MHIPLGPRLPPSSLEDAPPFHQDLRAIYRSRVRDAFGRARACLTHARLARQVGDHDSYCKLLLCVAAFRLSAARWRKRAARATPVFLLCLLSCLGCTKAPTRELTVDFNTQPASDGSGVLWSLRFSREEYHSFLDSIPDHGDINSLAHHKVKELITAGFRDNDLSGCQSNYVVAKLADGSVAFIGECPAAHATLAGGI